MQNKMDLHIHTNASDGTDSVPALWKHIQESGIQMFAVTDHDTIEGSREMKTLVDDRARLISGVEFSCKTDTFKCHILGYGFDYDHPQLVEALKEGEALRREKLEVRLEYLEKVRGIQFPEDVLVRLRGMKTVGKPHIAREMVNLGLADSIDSAIQNVINGCKAGDDRIEASKAIAAIREAGGITVWAHPLGGEGKKHLSPDVFRERLEVLLQAKIQGLECHYSRYDQEEAKFLCQVAAANGLYVTGGSDYHGENKTISLGELNVEGRAVTIPKELLPPMMREEIG